VAGLGLRRGLAIATGVAAFIVTHLVEPAATGKPKYNPARGYVEAASPALAYNLVRILGLVLIVFGFAAVVVGRYRAQRSA